MKKVAIADFPAIEREFDALFEELRFESKKPWERADAAEKLQTFAILDAQRLAARRLADARRRAGDPKASPNDYECGCPLSSELEPPWCEQRRALCRFADLRLRSDRRPTSEVWKSAFLRHYHEWRAALDSLDNKQGMRVVVRLLLNEAVRRIEKRRVAADCPDRSMGSEKEVISDDTAREHAEKNHSLSEGRKPS